MDCNEKLVGGYPRVSRTPANGFPAPPRVAHWGHIAGWQFSGYGEWVERDIAARWCHLCGADASNPPKYVCSRDDANAWFDNTCNVFAYKETVVPKSGTYDVYGKWWKCSGNGTVLTMPPSWLVY